MNEIMKIGLTADVGSFINNMGKAGLAVDALGATFGVIGSTVKRATAEAQRALIKLAAGAAGIVASLAGATMAASSYETGLRNVQSITKDTWATTSGLGSELLNFSRTTTTGANDLVSSLYDVASSGFAGQDALDVVKASAIAASAGMSDAKTAGFALSGALNAYGMSAKDVTSVSDIMFQTVNLGVLTFQDLADGMGQWIAMAATARVPLEDAAAALAAITRAGVIAPEASTGLARILQSFLNPTKEMMKLTKQLGFESSEAMLHQLGLKKAVETVGQASGGSAGKVKAFFGDIRAGVAAFALLSGAGQNYNTVAAGFTDKTQLAGATQKAFAIQSRGLGAQLTMLKNNIHANVIEIGQYLLPATRLAASSLNKLVGAAELIPGPMRGAVAGATALTAALMAGVAAWGLWYIKSSLLKKALGTSNVAFFGISRALLQLSIMSKSDNIFKMASAFEMASSKGGKLRGGLFLINKALGGLGVPIRATAMGMGIASAAAAAAVGGYIAWTSAVKNADKHAQNFVKTLRNTEDVTSMKGVSESLDTVNRKMRMAQDDTSLKGNWWFKSLDRLGQNLSPLPNKIEDAEAKVRALREEQGRLITIQGQWKNSASNVNAEIIRLTRSTGDSGKNIHLTGDEVTAFAKTLGVDLSEGGAKGEAGLVKIAQAAIDASAAGISMGSNYGKAATEVVAMSQKAGEAAQKFADDVRGAYRSSFDIVGKFSGSVIDDFNKFKMESPRDTLTGKLLKDQHGKPLPKVKVVVEGQFKKEEIVNFYKGALRQNEIFSRDINEAIRQGLDPNLIKKFLEAGPAEGSKLLHNLISDKDLSSMANRYESTLQRMAAQTAEVGRITALAMNAPTDKLSKDLPKALKISQNVMMLNGKGMEATFEAVAKAAHLPVKEVRKIGSEFGISMTDVVRSFEDLPISAQLNKVLAAQLIDVKTPKNVIDQMVKNMIGGQGILDGITKEMAAAFDKRHPELHLPFIIDGKFKQVGSDEEVLKTFLGAEGLNVNALISIIPDYKQAMELKGLLIGDAPKEATINALLKYVTDRSAPDDATKALVFAALSGQISTATLQYGLKMIGTPEALRSWKELKKERELKEGRTITFKFDGKEVEVGINQLKEKVKGFVAHPVTIRAQVVEETRTGRPKIVFSKPEVIDKTSKLYLEIVKEAKTDKKIKIGTDGSVDITKNKLEAIKQKLENIAPEKKRPRTVNVTPGPDLDPTRRKVKDIQGKLDYITGQTWSVNVNVKQTGKLTTPSWAKINAYGSILPMAQGGVEEEKRPRQAHIVKKPTVLYGEQGTGGEAYIPLAMSGRKRSEKLLASVANKFGMNVTKMASGDIVKIEPGGVVRDEKGHTTTIANHVEKNKELFNELVHEAKTDKTINVQKDGSVEVTKSKLTDITKRLEETTAKKLEDTNAKKKKMLEESTAKKNTLIEQQRITMKTGGVVKVDPGGIAKNENVHATTVINRAEKNKEIYNELVHEAKTDKTIKIQKDGSVEVTKSKLTDITKRLEETTAKKNTTINQQRITMAMGGVVEEKRPRPAHIVTRPTVIYGEQGTGGEAYIPLAKSRRKRSETLVTKVAKIFGMNVTKMEHGGVVNNNYHDVRHMAVGGIIQDERFQQAHVANVARNMAGSASFVAAVAEATKGIEDAEERAKAAQAALEEMAKTYRDVQMAAGTSAASQLAASGLVGDAWSQAAQRIIQSAEDTRHRWDNIWDDLWNKGKISSETYFNHLRQKMTQVKPYSDEWLSLRDAILQAGRATRQVAHSVGALSDNTYRAALRKQLAATRKYSDEWKTIWDEIEAVNNEIQDRIANRQDHEYAQHKSSTKTYLAELQRRLAGTKKWSSEYMSILGQIEQVQQTFKDPILTATNAISHFGTTAPQGFAEVSSYFTHAIEAAKRFNTNIAALKKMGLNTQLLMQLVQAGPSAVPFMDAILRGGAAAVSQTNASQAQLTSLAGQTQGAFQSGIGAPLASPHAPTAIRGAASQVTNNNQRVSVSVGAITIGAGSTISESQVHTAVITALQAVTDELGKRNN